MSYSLLNVHNIRIVVDATESTIDLMDLVDILETKLEEGKICGKTQGFKWHVLETKFIMIEGKLFEVDEKAKESLIKKVLKQTNNDVFEFQKILQDDFYINRLGYQNF